MARGETDQRMATAQWARAMRSRRNRRLRDSGLAWAFRWVIVPAVAILLIIVGAMGIGPAAAAALGHGTRGYFVPEQLRCGSGCSWLGDFMLPGGRITRYDVSLDNPHGPLSLDQPVPALDTGAQGTVFPPNGGRLWILFLIELVAGTAIAGLWTWRVLVRRLWRRRRVPDFLMPRV